jgi:RNA polymerase sigma-70 factor (ECF subfamily)
VNSPDEQGVEPEPPSDRSGLPDVTLVKAAQAGDMDAFEELVFRHRDKIYARAYNMVRHETEALDLSQQAWIKAWKRLGQFQGESSFTTWLTRITINLCIDHLNAARRIKIEEPIDLKEKPDAWERLLPPVWTNPTERLEREELRRRIDMALSQLSEAHRTALVLYEFEGMEYKEIARVIGISIGTVMSRLFYARRHMAVLLADLQEGNSPHE